MKSARFFPYRTHTNVVDRYRFDADLDPNFLFDTDQDPDPDLHQNDADPRADPTASFTDAGKSNFFQILVIALPVYNVYLSH
jgi:hypothetical protein